jgi:hypothetical protein
MAEGQARFGRADLKSVLFERASLPHPFSSFFTYCTGAFRAASTTRLKQHGGFPRAGNAEDQKVCEDTLAALASELTSFAGHLLCEIGSVPFELYHPTAGSHAKCVRQFNGLLQRGPNESAGFPPGFLQKMVSQLEAEGHGEPFIAKVFGPLLELTKGPINPAAWGDLQPMLHSLVRMSEARQVGLWVAQSPTFLPALRVELGSSLEQASLLGKVMSATPVGHESLANVPKRTQVDVDQTVERLRSSLIEYHEGINNLMKGLVVKADKETRSLTLAWVAKTLRLNKKRGQMRYDPSIVSSDAGLIALTRALLTLCKPIITAKKPKYDAVDLNYLRVAPACASRLDYTDVTRLYGEGASGMPVPR